MTRKDYVALARAFYRSRPIDVGQRSADAAQASLATWLESVEYVSHVLAADNPRFDRARFERACMGS